MNPGTGAPRVFSVELAIDASPRWLGCTGPDGRIGTRPENNCSGTSLHTSCPMLGLNVSTYVALFAAETAASMMLIFTSSSSTNFRSSALIGTYGQQPLPSCGVTSG